MVNKYIMNIQKLQQYLSKHNGNLRNALNIELGLGICLIIEVKINEKEVLVFYNQ